MPRGYPDFFGYSIFPFFGTFQLEEDSKTIVGAGFGTMGTISGKGKIYYGYISISYATTIFNDTIRLYADGLQLVSWRVDVVKEIQLINNMLVPLSVLRYDEALARVDFLIGQDITFGQSFEIGYTCLIGTTRTIASKVLWSQII